VIAGPRPLLKRAWWGAEEGGGPAWERHAAEGRGRAWHHCQAARVHAGRAGDRLLVATGAGGRRPDAR
jgi:hypothetical protein